MTPTALAVGLVLISAVMHAGWNLMLKMSGDKLIMAWGIRCGSLLVAIPFVVIAPPSAEVLPYVLISGLLHTLYDLALVSAYRLGEFSLVYTFARGISPAMAALLAFFALGETLTALAIAGLVTTVIGLLMVSGSVPNTVNHPRRATTWSLVTAVVIACYTVLDAGGVRIEGNATGYVGAIFIVNFLSLTPVAVSRRWGHADWSRLWREWRPAGIAAALQITAYALVVFALGLSPVGYITSLRETGVVFAAILGWWILKEPYGSRRILGTAAVVAGVVTLSFG